MSEPLTSKERGDGFAFFCWWRHQPKDTYGYNFPHWFWPLRKDKKPWTR